MNSPRPLFIASIGRPGTSLATLMLDSHPQICVATDVFQELYRSLRGALVRVNAPPLARERFDEKGVFEDYYFTDERIARMDAVQRGCLAAGFDDAEWDRLLERCCRGAEAYAADLIPLLDELAGNSYRQLFDNALDVVAEAREGHLKTWIGMQDGWTVEFFRPLARAYPDARFLLLLPDPRQMVQAMFDLAARDPVQLAQPLTYARHWRKAMAFRAEFRQDPVFQGRLLTVRTDELEANPTAMAETMCCFLDLDPHPSMLDRSRYIDHNSGRRWLGSEEDLCPAMDWRASLPEAVGSLIELICGAEMTQAGFPIQRELSDPPLPDSLAYLMESNLGYANWRTDLADPQDDYGYELFRRELLRLSEVPEDASAIRRCFLFQHAYESLRPAVYA